jgi:arabinose-5-phosphate isomerase
MESKSLSTQANTSGSPVSLFRQVLRTEAEALIAGAERAGSEVETAVRILQQTAGQVVFTGLGKAGCVARKGAATFCSTGTPATYLHPSEALHGDIGVVTGKDTLVAISNSGETAEVLALLPYFARIGAPVIAITGNPGSALANRSRVVLDAAVSREADPIATAPTSSTTLAMAICDALAVALMTERGFTREQFAIFHPGGNLGRKLLLRVNDLMRIGDSVPIVTADSHLSFAISVMTQKKIGAVFIVDFQSAVIGVLTDGDLRRWYQQVRSSASPTESRSTNPDPLVIEAMTRNPKHIAGDALAAEALKLMEDHQISVLAVVDPQSKLVGALHLHDLIRAGLA